MFLLLLPASVHAQLTKPEPVQPSRAPTATALRTMEIKQLLSDRGFWITRVDSTKDPSYTAAISSFRRLNRLAHTKTFTDNELALLRSSRRPVPHRQYVTFPNGVVETSHIEVDLDRQVIMLVDSSGIVAEILPTSTGNGHLFTTIRPDGTPYTRRAKTPVGLFRVSRKIRGWRTSELGKLYFPMYFRGGTAIHGSGSVPEKPASHGCVRIPLFAAESLFIRVSIRMPVLVHQ